jgi:RHS repeat-associated protein
VQLGCFLLASAEGGGDNDRWIAGRGRPRGRSRDWVLGAGGVGCSRRAALGRLLGWLGGLISCTHFQRSGRHHFGADDTQRRGSADRMYHFDGLGSTDRLTDGGAAITDNYVYQAFGALLIHNGLSSNSFLYVGQLGYYFDPDTTILYVRERYYTPLLGRWLTQDPLGYEAGYTNMYHYVFNHPTVNVDPSGLQARGPVIVDPRMIREGLRFDRSCLARTCPFKPNQDGRIQLRLEDPINRPAGRPQQAAVQLARILARVLRIPENICSKLPGTPGRPPDCIAGPNDPSGRAVPFFLSRCAAAIAFVQAQHKVRMDLAPCDPIKQRENFDACREELGIHQDLPATWYPGVLFHCDVVPRRTPPTRVSPYNVAVTCCVCCDDQAKVTQVCIRPHWGSDAKRHSMGPYKYDEGEARTWCRP